MSSALKQKEMQTNIFQARKGLAMPIICIGRKMFVRKLLTVLRI